MTLMTASAPTQNRGHKLAEALARRLSFLQTALAEEPADEREGKLADEINRALQQVSDAERKKCLDTLVRLFPSWVPDPGSATNLHDKKKTVTELADALCEASGTLSHEERRALSRRLVMAGLITNMGEEVTDDAFSEIRNRLKMADSERLDAQRMGRVFASMHEMVCALDQLAWNIWRTMAPRSGMKREQGMPELRTVIKRALLGDESISSTQVASQLENTRRLIASLIASIDSAGLEFAETFHGKYSPDAIRHLASREGKSGLFENHDARLWQRYVECYASNTPSIIHASVRDHLVRHAETLACGNGR